MNPYASLIHFPGRTDKLNQLAHVSLIDGVDNTAVGVNTAHVSGAQNTVVGAYAGTLDAASHHAVLVGHHTGNAAQTLAHTVAIGAGALSSATVVRDSVFVGSLTAGSARAADLCTALGYASGERLSTGVRTTLVGAMCGQFSFNTQDDTFVGYACGRACRDGARNVGVGALCGAALQTGADNVLVGYMAGANMVTAHQCVGVGAMALEHAANASNVIAIGTGAGRYATGARDAIFIGGWGRDEGPGESGIETGNCVFVGIGTGFAGFDNVGIGTSTLPMVSGRDNVALGTTAGFRLLDGDSNVLVGSRSGAALGSAQQNVLVGVDSGATLLGGENTGLGTEVGPAGISFRNTCVGHQTGTYAVGSENVIVGAGACKSSSVTRQNVVVGALAATRGFAGDNNIVLGANACSTFSGNNNIVLGCQSFDTFTGSRSVVIGTDMNITKPLNDVTLVGSYFTEEYDSTQISNCVVVGRGVVLSDRDSNSLVLSAPELGDVVRATTDSTTFGSEISRRPIDVDLIGPPDEFVTARYGAENMPHTILAEPGGVWYDVHALAPLFEEDDTSARDGFYGQPASPLLDHPEFYTEPAYANCWQSLVLTRPMYIQGLPYHEAAFHQHGLCCFHDGYTGRLWGYNSTPAPLYPERVTYEDEANSAGEDIRVVEVPDAARILGPTLLFSAKANVTSATLSYYHFIGIDEFSQDDILSRDFYDANLCSTAEVIRWEASGPNVFCMVELTVFHPATGFEGIDNIFRFSFSPGLWPYEQRPEMYLSGLDGVRLASSPMGNEANCLVYFVPKSTPDITTFSPWFALSPGLRQIDRVAIQMTSWFLFFDEYVDAIYVTRDGTMYLKRPVDVEGFPTLKFQLAVLQEPYAYNPESFVCSRVLLLRTDYADLESVDNRAYFETGYFSPASEVVTRIRIELLFNGNPVIYECEFGNDSVVINFTDTVRNLPSNTVFQLEYRGVRYRIPRTSGLEVSTNRIAPAVFAGGRVVINNLGINLAYEYYINGSGAMLYDIPPSAIVYPGTYGDGYFETSYRHASWQWETVTGSERIIHWSDINPGGGYGRCWAFGILYVFANASLFVNEPMKQGIIIASVIRNTTLDIQVTHKHTTPALGTFDVVADGNRIKVYTDIDCHVTWKWSGSVVRDYDWTYQDPDFWPDNWPQ